MRQLYDSDDYPPTRIAATFADRFIAGSSIDIFRIFGVDRFVLLVVSAETVFRHDGGVDASMINVTTHQRVILGLSCFLGFENKKWNFRAQVIDLYDSVDNEWYRNQLDHHAGIAIVWICVLFWKK